jgi:hydroxymethylbilane synthase
MSSIPDSLVIASRGSRLAQRQARIVSELVTKTHPRVAVEISTVATAGDRDRRSFAAIGGRGLFFSEVEREVVERRADVAVHSAKDLTSDLAPGCAIVCVPPRAAVADVVIGGGGEHGEERLRALRPGATVGTSSMRRRLLVGEARPDVEVVEFRGNLDTRLAKVARGEVDAAILAAAGIERLGAEVSCAPLDPEWWIPAPAQGALAVEALAARVDLAELFAPLEDPQARAEISCERTFARTLEGGCSVPLGCLARAGAGGLVATGWLASPLTAQSMRDRISGPVVHAEALGAELAHAVLAGGGDELLADARDADAVEPSPP